MRDIPLTVVEGGIQRLRTKGGANPKSLYDLVNGYVTADRKVRRRPGTFRVAELPAGTKGLVAFRGAFHVFAHETVAGLPDGFVLHVLQHPARENLEGDPIPIKRIHFAQPFMGALYVVAEFDVTIGGDIEHNVYHYWLQGEGNSWQADTAYKAGAIVSPTTPNGLYYRATRLGQPNPAWTPDTPITQGDLREPTVYNDFYFEAVQVLGDSPRTGPVEPDWPTETGAQIIEDVAGTENQGNAQPPEPAPTPLDQARYVRDLLAGKFGF